MDLQPNTKIGDYHEGPLPDPAEAEATRRREILYKTSRRVIDQLPPMNEEDLKEQTIYFKLIPSATEGIYSEEIKAIIPILVKCWSNEDGKYIQWMIHLGYSFGMGYFGQGVEACVYDPENLQFNNDLLANDYWQETVDALQLLLDQGFSITKIDVSKTLAIDT